MNDELLETVLAFDEPVEKHQGGRPPIWTPEKKAQAQAHICQQIAMGRSLVSICKSDEGMPHYATVMNWRSEDPGFDEKYARAREEQADFLAEEIIEIADSATDANLARLRVDARKWKAGKLKPKVYGERINLDADIGIRISDEQLESRLAHLLGKTGVAVSSGREGEAEEAA